MTVAAPTPRVTSQVPVPGTDALLTIERDERARLVRVACGDRVYLEEQDGVRILGDGLAEVREVALARGLLRHVRAGDEMWTEEYRWNTRGRPTVIDGAAVRRDAEGRVVACGDWRYDYSRAELVSIRGPHGVRTIARGERGRPVRVRHHGEATELRYDEAGRRVDVAAAPSTWSRDEYGRLWTVRDTGGRITATYLWDGWACFGRIDGPLGDPLAAAFSLDPSGTPVRIVTRDGATRIPRDAFGEALLAHAGVPGLHGGAVHGGVVHLRGRELDPRTGSFTAPDPWSGLADDPRRASGYPGVLTVEAQDSGPYTVCRNDPVGRTDPTGEVSVPLLLSTLTWSSQYNLANFVFLDLFVNFWAGLFTGQLGRWVDRSFMYSERRGNFGFRMDPVGLESWVKLFAGELRRFTLHHVFWCPSNDEAFGGLERVRVWAPGPPSPDPAAPPATFRPTLYGTLLRATPEHGPPFLLRGSAATAFGVPARAEGWTRAGGTAEAVVPGSTVPAFPSGGIHFSPRGDFDDVDGQHVLPDGIFGRQDGSMTELEPAGAVVQGTIAERLVLSVPGTGHDVAGAGRKLFLSDHARPASTTVAEVAGAAERDGHTKVDLVSLSGGLAATPVHVRRLGDRRSRETLRGSAFDRLDVKDGSSTVRYAAGDVLAFAQNGHAVGGTTVERLEAQLTLDAPVPATYTAPFRVRRAQTGGPSRPLTKVAADVLEFPAGQDLPPLGSAIVVSGGGAATAVRLLSQPADRQRKTDRPLAAALTGDLTWRTLAVGEELGRRDGAAEAAAQVTYAPVSSGRAPSSGHVVVVDAHDQILPRDVSALGHDEAVLTGALPGDATQPYEIDRHAFDGANVDGAEFDQAVTLGGAAPVPGVAVVLHQLTGNAVAAGSTVLLHDAALSGTRASVAFPPAAGAFPLGEASTGAPVPGQLVVLEDGSHAVAPAVVRAVKLTVGLDRPLPYAAGTALECVPLGPDGFEYEAEQVGPLLVSVLPAARSGVVTETVQLPRLRVGELVRVRWDQPAVAPADERLYRIAAAEGTTVTLAGGKPLPAATPGLRVTRFVPADPRTGGSRVGRNGSITATTPTDCTIQLDVWQPNALRPGTAVALTDNATTLPAFVATVKQLDVDFFVVSGLSGATVSVSAADLAADPVYVGSFTQDGARLIVPRSSLESGTKLVLAVPYVATARTQTGHFDPGAVLIPNDPEYPELSRLQALIDHELLHTEQAAMWGPLLLSPFPTGAFGDLLEGLGADPNHWLMGIGHNVGRLWSIGGLMTLVEGSVISGFVWFLLKLFFFFDRLFSGQPLSFGWLAHMDWLSFFPGTTPDASRPNRIHVASSNGSTLSLAPNDLVEVTDGTSFRRTKVRALADGDIDLDDPPPAATFQIAKVGSDDPTLEIDSWVSTNTGLGGLQYAFDPYGEIAVRNAPDPSSFWFYFARIARDLFGSTAWSGLPFGYFWFDNAVHNSDGHGHLSQMEQQASEESGEVYSPIGRLRGRLEYVGDVARYWYFIDARHGSVVLDDRQDAPGVLLTSDQRLVPAVVTNAPPTPPGGTAPTPPDPNGWRQVPADPLRPGLALPDELVRKKPAQPNAAAETGPRSFAVADRGWIPASPRLERTSGVYVSFSAPGRHLVSTRNGIDGDWKAREAQDRGKQQLWFEKTVADVEVRVAGTVVPRPADPTTPLPRVRLVQRQRATIEVTPNGDRIHAAALVRPASGLVLRAVGPLVVAAQGTNGVEPVQLDRVHAYDGTSHAFATEALHTRGVHLPEDLRIPVRLFEVEVVDTLPLRRAADPASEEIVTARPGESAFVLVPAQVSRPLALAAVRYPGGAPDRTRNPAPVVTAPPSPAALAAFLGSGAVFQVAFPAGDPPEETAELTLDVDVVGPVPPGTPAAAIGAVLGSNSLHSILTALVTLEPHFQLVKQPAGGDFTVARGSSITLRATHGVTPGAVTVTPAAGVTVTKAGSDITLAVDAAAAPGRRRVVVDDSTDATKKGGRTVEILP
ncbi:MAG TPA: hypothetical protein VGJ77_20060 [Gaiellaceae bacterium]